MYSIKKGEIAIAKTLLASKFLKWKNEDNEFFSCSPAGHNCEYRLYPKYLEIHKFTGEPKNETLWKIRNRYVTKLYENIVQHEYGIRLFQIAQDLKNLSREEKRKVKDWKKPHVVE